jgi:hypothetical protein
MIRKIEIERFSLTTSKAFNEVIAGVNAAIGHPDMAEFGISTHEARSFVAAAHINNLDDNRNTAMLSNLGPIWVRLAGSKNSLEDQERAVSTVEIQ